MAWETLQDGVMPKGRHSCIGMGSQIDQGIPGYFRNPSHNNIDRCYLLFFGCNLYYCGG